jgi:hypothetical protein
VIDGLRSIEIHRHQYSAGSRSWRTNNPGLLPANEITWPYGAIGEALSVAVFKDPESGRRALRGSLWLPMPLGETGAALNEDEPQETSQECEVWRWEEVRDVLHMHRGKWEMLQMQRRKVANQAQLERIEARLKQDKGD